MVTPKGLFVFITFTAGFTLAASGQISSATATNTTKATAYSDQEVVAKYRALTDATNQTQLERLSNDLKTNGVNFTWSGDEVIKLEQNKTNAINVTEASGIQALLLKAGLIPGPASNSMWSVLIWTGAKLENPYSISNGVLLPNNTKTDGFFELELVHRYVVASDLSNLAIDDMTPWGKKPRPYGNRTTDSYGWYWPGQVFPDLDFRVGYVFTGTSTPTNLTVSTIAGGSDLSSDNSIGLPFWRWSEQGAWNQQATIELGGGFVTDKQFLATHPNYFIGLGYQFHNRDWTWQTRFGLGAADIPRLTSGSTVATNSTGLPVFYLKQAPTWGTIITYNLNPSVNVQVGANAYFDTRATWNLSAGISIDPAAAFKSFAK